MNRPLLLLGALLFLLSGCDSLDKAEPTPSYIYISSVELASKPFFGTTSQDFTEVYAYIDGNLLGAFPIPGLIPVLATGDHTFSLFAGVHMNGIKSSAEVYPVLEKYEVPIKLEAGKIDTISPVLHYRADVSIGLLEDFEGVANIFTAKLQGDGVIKDNTDVFEGNYSGALKLDTIKPLIEVGTVDISLPKDGRRIYLELHYKNDVDFIVGIKAFNTANDGITEYIIGLKPSTEWKKVYVDITDQVLVYDYSYYKILIETGLPIDGNTYKVLTGKVLIDNFKVLY